MYVSESASMWAYPSSGSIDTTTPSTPTCRRMFAVSTITNETRGSRLALSSHRPSAALTVNRSPSRPHHTTTVYGLPSARSVLKAHG